MTTSPAKRVSPKTRQRGVAAVEAALIVPIFVVLLTVPIYYARCFWHYTVAQKAAQDAARYLSQVSAAEMKAPALAQAAGNIALQIAQKEMTELAPGSAMGVPVVQCDYLPCGTVIGTPPATVRVYVTFSMYDDIFGVIDAGRFGLVVTADISMRYVGN
ncbi:TadE/TadG family type IV pilus assembly protein [Massilia sp. GER05]|uniref:TadE/TadG family type IV pilus assembly protein n=1 Tax=Massilia sp. GER05 TaxID=3394605 RepID=UPI003F877136